MFGVILLILGAMAAWSEVVDWRERVKNNRPPVMSRPSDTTPPIDRPSLEDRRETDARQTPIVLPERKIKAEELLTLYALMRRYNIPREAAAAAFKAVDLPFNSNVWRDAAPEEDVQVTPIAGRPTPAKFHDDPELEYQPLR